MHILIGIAMAVALLYWWLIGHWFARVLVFLLLACVGFVAGAALANTSPNAPAAGVIILGLIGAAFGWPIAGLPTYYWRHQMREYLHSVYGVPKDYSDAPLTDSARRHGYR